MDIVKRYYFLVLAFFPVLQFVFLEYFGRSFVLVYGALGTVLYFLYLFSGQKLVYPKYLLPLILITLYYLGWDLVNGLFAELKSGFLTYIYSNRWIHTITILILIENTRFDEKFIRSILILFRVTIVIALIFSAIQVIVDPYFFTPEKFRLAFLGEGVYEIRLTSIFGYLSTTELGNSFIPIVSILVGYYLCKKEKFQFVWLVMAGLVVFANKSRYLYLNFVIILMQYFLVRRIHFTRVVRISAIVLASAIVVVVFLQTKGFDFEEFIQTRLLSESATTRLLAVDLFLEFFPRNPYFGSGIHVAEDLYYAIGGRSSQIHVGYLSHLYEYGIVGSVILFSFWYMVTDKFYVAARKTRYYGSLFAFVAFLVTNLTGVVYGIFFYGMLYAFIFNKYMNDQYLKENISAD